MCETASDLWYEGVNLGQHILWASTFGTCCINPSDGRAAGASNWWRRLHPEITYAREVAPDTLPSTITYDAGNDHLIIEGGVFTGVTPRMRNYTTGGRNVLDSWLGYRSNRAAGKVTSELDRERSEGWEPEWSRELVEILAVLSNLTSLEPRQAGVHNRIVVAPLIDVAELTRRRNLPVPEHAEHAHTGPDSDFLPGMESVDGRLLGPVAPLPPPNAPQMPPRLGGIHLCHPAHALASPAAGPDQRRDNQSIVRNALACLLTDALAGRCPLVRE